MTLHIALQHHLGSFELDVVLRKECNDGSCKYGTP